MTTTHQQQVRLDRAYFQSKVIAANLEHLSLMVSGAGADLREDLAIFTDRFDQYVRRLERACTAGASSTPQRVPAAATRT